MIQNFLNEHKINGKAEKTLEYYRSILKEANEFKLLSDWSKDDVNGFVLHLQSKNKKSSVEVKKGIIKNFFTWMGKPEIVAHLKMKRIQTDLKREDILDVEDVNRLIEATESPMYKALIAFLFESGARINEALQIRVDDVLETDKGMIIGVIQTKTGLDRRRGLYVYSSGYIRNHITYSGLSKKDRLFPITGVAVGMMLKKIGESAGIEKPISPHKFRHAQATDMVLRGYQESVIRKKLGWTGDSKMIARYQHIVDEDVINATAEKAGSDIPRQPMANLKQAESLKIADASLQLSKLSEENQQLKTQMEATQKGYNELKAHMEATQNLMPVLNEMMSRLQYLNAKQQNPINLENAIIKEAEKYIDEQIGKQKHK